MSETPTTKTTADGTVEPAQETAIIAGSPLNTVEEDSCCAARLNKALLADANLRQSWYCPKCGQEWRYTTDAGKHIPCESAEAYRQLTAIRYWQPIVECAVIKP